MRRVRGWPYRHPVGALTIGVTMLAVFALASHFLPPDQTVPVREPVAYADHVGPSNPIANRALFYWRGALMAPMTVALAKSLGCPESGGMYVAKLAASTPAARAGLRPGDILTALDDMPVGTPRLLVLAVTAHPAEPIVRLQVRSCSPHRQTTLLARTASLTQPTGIEASWILPTINAANRKP